MANWHHPKLRMSRTARREGRGQNFIYLETSGPVRTKSSRVSHGNVVMATMIVQEMGRTNRGSSKAMLHSCKGPFTNDISREGEGGGCPNSDAVRGGCVILVL